MSVSFSNERANSAPNNNRNIDTLSIISDIDNNSMSLNSNSRPNSRQQQIQHNNNTTSSNNNKKVIKEYLGESTLHTKIREGLQSCSLDPIHLEIHNESYWYIMRKKLGAKRHQKLITIQNNLLQWESYIYDIKLRESDNIRVPMKSHIKPDHKTKWAALKHAELAAKERDANPYGKLKCGQYDPSNIESTHFRIFVVSHKFDRLSNKDRLSLVHNILTEKLGINVMPSSSLFNKSKDNNVNNDKLIVENENEIHVDSPSKKDSPTTKKAKNTTTSMKSDTIVVTTKPGYGLGRCPPTRIKMGSYFGQRMCQLLPFRFILSDTPITFIIYTKSPSEWRPELYIPPISERFGQSHIGMTSGGVLKEVRPAANIKRMKNLTMNKDKMALKRQHEQSKEQKRDNDGPVPLNELPQHLRNLGETLGMDPSLTPYKKKGGVYGHFFTDLTPVMRDLVLDRVKFNKHKIQMEGFKVPEEKKKKKKKDTFQPVTGMSKLRDKLNAQITADYDKGTATEEEMIEEVYVSAKEIERAAIRLQRIWRIAVLPAVARKSWRKQYSAITIQRCIRGYYGRLYAKLLAKLKPIAAIKIQRFRRAYKDQVRADKWKVQIRRLTRVALPRIKRFLRNCFLSWEHRHDKMAISIQKVIRMYLCRIRYYRTLGYKYLYGVEHFQKAALHIQRNYRGWMGRKINAKAGIEKMLQINIDLPACIKIQRVFRGSKGRIKAKRRALEIYSANFLQRNFAKFVRRIWTTQVIYARKLQKMATRIQKHIRGYLDRLLVLKKKYKYWYQFVYIPAIITVQATIRRIIAEVDYRKLVHYHKNAKYLQLIWKSYLLRCAAAARWQSKKKEYISKLWARVQKIIRGKIARKNFKRIALIASGKYLNAAKKILRAWVNFKYAKRLQLLLDDHRLLIYSAKAKKVTEARISIVDDVKEVHVDIDLAEASTKRTKARITILQKFLMEAELRCQRIQNDLLAMTIDDVERGWADAYGVEYEMLNHQITMGKEEMRLLRNQVIKRRKELDFLYSELEEYELEFDKLSVLEAEYMETLRRAEVRRVGRRVQDRWARLVRIEKCKWKIESNRMNVVNRNRPNYKALMKKSQEDRNFKYMTTLSYEIRQQQRDKEQLLFEKYLQDDGTSNSVDVKTYEDYAKPIQIEFDAIVKNSMDILRGFSLDERAERIKKEASMRARAKKFKTGGQFASLKKEYQDKNDLK